MANLKKNQVNQIMFTMVDKTDFATVESAMTAGSNIKVRLWGLNHAGSAAASTISLAAAKVAVVNSGIFRAVFQMNKDIVALRASSLSTISCAVQVLQFEQVTWDDVDLSALISDVYSQAALGASYASDAYSLITKNYSRLLVTQSIASDAYSAAILGASQASDTYSLLEKNYSRLLVTQSIASDAYSAAILGASHASDTYSLLEKNYSRLLVVQSIASDAYSAAILGASHASDALSAISDMRSFIRSNLSAPSFLSNIASQVWKHTRGSTVFAYTSDLYSFIRSGLSDAISDIRVDTSDLRSFVRGTIASNVSLAYSSTSDLRSFVRGTIASNVSLVYSSVSDLRSFTRGALSDFISDLRSDISASISDMRSYLLSASYLSDVASAIWGQKWDIHSTASTFGSAFAKIFESGVPVDNSHMSQLRSAITAGPATANTTSIARAVWMFSNTDASGLSAGTYGSNISAIYSKVQAINSASNIASVVWGANYKTGQFSAASTVGSLLRNRASTVSKLYSLVGAAATASDVASAVWGAKWDVHSTASTFGSAFAKIFESGVTLTVSDLSDIRSAITAAPAASIDYDSVASAVWDGTITAHSDAGSFGSMVGKRIGPYISDLRSYVRSQLSSHISAMSDFRSYARSNLISMTSSISDIRSCVSDLRSYVRSQLSSHISAMSDFRSYTRSNLVSLTSSISDIRSCVSDLRSFTRSAIASWLSDIYSSVSELRSYARSTMTSYFSDIYSSVSDLRSYVRATLTPSNITSYMWTTDATGSDILSGIGKLRSRVTSPVATQSKLGAVQANTSGAMSFLSDIYSQVTTTTSYLSDIYSSVSDLRSFVRGTIASNVSLAYSSMSDLRSFVRGALSDQISTMRSYLSSASYLSDIASMVWGQKWDIHSDASTFGSAFAKMFESGVPIDNSHMSQIRSRIDAGAPGTVTADNISDIASAVWAESISTLKGVAASFGSRFAKLTTSDALSKAQSDLRSLMGGITATVDYNSVASAIWDATLTAHSDAGSFGSKIGKTMAPSISNIVSMCSDMVSVTSDIYSSVSDLRSFARATLASNASLIYSSVSDLRSFTRGKLNSMVSDLRSYVGSTVTSYLSDIYSSVSDLRSYARGQMSSWMSDVYSSVSDLRSYVRSTIYSAAYAGALNASALSDIAVAVWAEPWDTNSDAGSFGSLMEVMGSNLSQLRSDVEDSYTDAEAVTANSLRDRVRTQGWVLRNKMATTDATGDTILYKDDNATEAFSVAAALADDGITTTRKRIE